MGIIFLVIFALILLGLKLAILKFVEKLGLFDFLETSAPEHIFLYLICEGIFIIVIGVLIYNYLPLEFLLAVTPLLFLNFDASSIHNSDKASQELLFKILPYNEHSKFLNQITSMSSAYLATDEGLIRFKLKSIEHVKWSSIINIKMRFADNIIIQITTDNQKKNTFDHHQHAISMIMEKLHEKFPSIPENWKNEIWGIKDWVTVYNTEEETKTLSEG